MNYYDKWKTKRRKKHKEKVIKQLKEILTHTEKEKEIISLMRKQGKSTEEIIEVLYKED